MRILELKLIIEKLKKTSLSLIDNRKNLTILYFSLFVLSTITLLLGFEWSVYVIWWLLGFGWSMFFFKKSVNLLEHFLLGGIVFTVLFLVFLCIFAIVNIPINIFFFLIFVVISFFAFLKFKVFKNINLKVKDYDYLVLFLFFVALIAKVYPLRNSYAAPLHDPIAHSMMARNIVNTGLIEYFYSPGLHIIAAFGELSKGFDVAKQVMILSGVFSAYSGIAAYVFVKNFFKDKVWGLVTAILFSVGYYPAMLTFNAGKNTFIMAIPILFFVMFAITQYIKFKNWKVLAISGVAIASLFLTHYPMAVIGSVFVGVVFLVYLKEFRWKGLLIILGILFGLGWAARSYRYQVALVELLVNPERTSVGYLSNFGNLSASIFFFLNKSKDYLLSNLKDSNWNKVPTILGILAFLVIPIKNTLKMSLREITIFLFVSFCFLLFLFLSILDLSLFTILFETYFLSFSIYLYILCGFICALITKHLLECFTCKSKIEGVLIGVLIFVITFLSILSYRKTVDYMREANYLNSSDVEVFQWIEKNIDKKDKILINSHSWMEVIFSSDAGGYLEIFTGNKISAPFYEYDHKETLKNHILYENLKEDINNCEYRNGFVDRGYPYYYQGSLPIYSPYIAEKEVLIESSSFEVIKEVDNSVLYKIIECD